MPEHNRGNFSNSKPHSRKPKNNKPKAWSHQDDLKQLVGKNVTLILTEDWNYEVKLLAADQFTLNVEHKNGSRSVIFKHALLAYFPS